VSGDVGLRGISLGWAGERGEVVVHLLAFDASLEAVGGGHHGVAAGAFVGCPGPGAEVVEKSGER